MSAPLVPGLLVLHGNRVELLADATFAWLAAHPLAPLEEELVLVPSNGMAEWLKMALADAHGICAATRVELPARFLWRAYRTVLGRAAVPALSPLDKLPLTWRLMGLLPRLAGLPVFAPVAGFLAAGDAPGAAARRLQLAQRLADLFDQYQVYRADWLHDWAEGRDQLRAAAGGGAQPLPAEQRWQPALWRAVLDLLTPDERQASRPLLQRRFLDALAPGRAAPAALPRRIVLFGTTHLPQQTLEAIAALSAHAQVLMAVPNPCRYHWADTVAGRELLHVARRRHPLREGRDLAAVPLQDMHAHGHPLLAGWGRQARDFVRHLDAFDDVAQAQAQFGVARVDLFDDGPGATLLGQVQACIRDLVPLAEHARMAPAADDRSIVFHVAHSAQREVEILHDQLLRLLAQPPGARPLAPRDIVVMVPDIEVFAPAIRAVFGACGRGHPRHLPWGIADLRERGQRPLLLALEWLLRAPQQRWTLGELRDLLEVPALARRFGLDQGAVATLVAWAEGAGVRWGLHAAQRGRLGLQACGETNSWRFGLRRLLLGYATGELASGHAGIEPHAEVAGLDAGLAGTLAELVDWLDAWWADAVVARTPAHWGLRLRALLREGFDAGDDDERALLAALDEALGGWLESCEAAGFDDALDLAVVRDAWLDAVDDPAQSRRFKAGGVTFCTLLPLRAIPFEVVCLLGMNDGDYPRRGARSDFDLMALPGLARPGDRSRRDDDRQLMLDALLSARRVLHVSWAGRSQRDNQAQPPSVLVAQLIDYLKAGWGDEVVKVRTTEHPLQPFSRRYFEAATGPLYTYAAEWRSAHAAAAEPAPVPEPATRPADEPLEIDIDTLVRFLRNPVAAFFRHRLRVSFDEIGPGPADDEAFASVGLPHWQQLDEVLREVQRPAAGADAARRVETAVARLQRAGRLPLAGPGAQVQAELLRVLQPMVAFAQPLQDEHPFLHDAQPLRLSHPDRAGLRFVDRLAGLRAIEAGASPLWIAFDARKLADDELKAPRADKLLAAWVRCLAAAACGLPARGVVIGSNAVVHVGAPAQARATLLALMQLCDEGLNGAQPLPTAVRTGVACLRKGPLQGRTVFEGGDFGGPPPEGRETCLARLFPDFATLFATPGFEAATVGLYQPLLDWIDAHVRLEALPDHAVTADDDD